MEASGSKTLPPAPATPSHPSLLPSLSPSGSTMEHTPAPIHGHGSYAAAYMAAPQAGMMAAPMYHPHQMQHPHQQHPHMMYVAHPAHGSYPHVPAPQYAQHPSYAMPPPGVGPGSQTGSNGMPPPPHFQPIPQNHAPQAVAPPSTGKVRKQSKGRSETPSKGGATPQHHAQSQTPTLASAHVVPNHGGGTQDGQMTPSGNQAGVFTAVMQQHSAPGAKVYASVYSGIPVFEAMIRGISVMRRTSDSWVNATQILKVAGIPKSARTKILEKEVLTGQHEKVQGGYGKYQGTWIPIQRGHELAAQYGVTAFLSPIFDFNPSPANVAALPVARGDGGKAAAAAAVASNQNAIDAATPDRPQKTPGSVLNYNQLNMNNGRTPTPASRVYAPSPAAHDQSPMPQRSHEMPLQPPPSFLGGEGMMMPPQPMYGGMYYAAPGQQAMPQSLAHAQQEGALAPAAELNGYGLPPSGQDVYIDAYGQAHATYMPIVPTTGTGETYEPAAKRVKSELYDPALGDMSIDYQAPALAPAQAVEEDQAAEEAEAEDDSSDSDEPAARNAPPIPSAMRFCTKPIRPKAGTAGKSRAKLMALFNEDVQDVRSHLGIPLPKGTSDLTMDGTNGDAWAKDEPDETPDIDVDAIIDDQGHTALHWAASLARMSLVSQLIELGADIHRGNYAGETPLIRSVLTTNHVESNTFPALLTHLGPSIRTIDHAHRSVVHHVALVAGVKGRAAAARSYMTAILGEVASGMKENQAHAAFEKNDSQGNVNGSANGTLGSELAPLNLKTLVDVQDVHGDTALNVAARVGNKGLIKVLITAGADKARANKLGLKPVDFGIEVEALKVSTGEAVVSSLKDEVPKPVRQSKDVQKNMSAIFENINEAFNAEMVASQSKLNVVEQNVRTATRTLAEKRQAVQQAQAAVSEVEILSQKTLNVRRAVDGPEIEQWHRIASTLSTSPGQSPLKRKAEGSPAVSMALPDVGSLGAVQTLKRMLVWEDRIAAILEERISKMRGQGVDEAVKYRKLVSLCTKTPVDKVDSVLEGLVAAVESDGNAVDLSQISKFIGKVNGGQPQPAQ